MMVIAYRPQSQWKCSSRDRAMIHQWKKTTMKRYPSNHSDHKKRKGKPTQVKEKMLSNAKTRPHLNNKVLVNAKTHPDHAWHRNSGWCWGSTHFWWSCSGSLKQRWTRYLVISKKSPEVIICDCQKTPVADAANKSNQSEKIGSDPERAKLEDYSWEHFYKSLLGKHRNSHLDGLVPERVHDIVA